MAKSKTPKNPAKAAWVAFLKDEYDPVRQLIHATDRQIVGLAPKKVKIKSFKYTDIKNGSSTALVTPITLESLAADIQCKPGDEIYNKLYSLGVAFAMSMNWPEVHEYMREKCPKWVEPAEAAQTAAKPEKTAERPEAQINDVEVKAKKPEKLSEYITHIARQCFIKNDSSKFVALRQSEYEELDTEEQKNYQKAPANLSLYKLSQLLHNESGKISQALSYVKKSHGEGRSTQFPSSSVDFVFDALHFTNDEKEKAEQIFFEEVMNQKETARPNK